VRTRSIGGSDANVILSGSPERVLRLWREKRGEEQPEDLSAKLPVMLGCWTEEFNRQWYSFSTGQQVSRVGERLTCSEHPWRACTLDGFVEEVGAVWEAKHTSSFVKPDEIVSRYMPQLQHNMAVAATERALLSVIFGNGKWEVFEVAADWLYQADLLAAETRFWECVQSGDAPAALPAPPPPKPIGVREVCLEGSNAWAASAADWLAHRDAARKHQAAITSLKELVEDDVARAFGHGIEAKRSKAGAITIRELAA
jgi:predicted phage-related endonuclease